MRILCISYEYPPIGGGGAPVCKGTAEALVAAGHEVDVITSGMKDLPAEEQIGSVNIHRVRCLRRRRHMADTLELATTLLPTYRKARQLAAAQKYDLVYTHFIVPSGVVAYWLNKATGLPYVITAHGSDVPGYNPDRFDFVHHLISPAWRAILKREAAVTTPSGFLASLIKERINLSIDVIPNGMAIPPRDDSDRRNCILAASRLFERKGVQDLIRAMEGVESDWELLVAGDGPYLPTLKNLAADLGVNAHFVGFLPREQLAELYRTSKIFAFPSHRENFPVVLLEAMAAGCAVVTADGSGSSEVVGDAAAIVEPGDVEALRKVMVELISNEAEITRMRLRSYERVQRFAWPRIAREFEKLFAHCLDRKAAETTTKKVHAGT